MLKCKYMEKREKEIEKKKFARSEIRTTNRLHENHVW